MNKLLIFTLLLFFALAKPAKAQFTESKERKKMWKKSGRRHKKREAFNPYLDKKTKPSQELSKQNARDIKRQTKMAKKQKKRSKKKTGH